MVPRFVTEKNSPDGTKSYYATSSEKRREHLISLIKTAIDIYSAMYKAEVQRRVSYGDFIGGVDVIRGSSHSLLNNSHGFISASRLEQGSGIQEAIYWATINNSASNINQYGIADYTSLGENKYISNGVLSHIHVQSGVPCIDVEGGNSNERETLISPFSVVKKDDSFGDRIIEANGQRLREEYVIVESRPLTQIHPKEQKTLYDEILTQADDMDSKIMTFYQLEKDKNDIVFKIQQNTKNKQLTNEQYQNKKITDKEFNDTISYLEKNTAELNTQLSDLREKSDAIKKDVLGWRNKISSFIEARCADKELEIASQIKEVTQKRSFEEIKKRDDSKLRNVRASEVKETISDSVDSAIQSDSYARMINCHISLERAAKIPSQGAIIFNSPIANLTKALGELKKAGNSYSISEEGYNAFN